MENRFFLKLENAAHYPEPKISFMTHLPQVLSIADARQLACDLNTLADHAENPTKKFAWLTYEPAARVDNEQRPSPVDMPEAQESATVLPTAENKPEPSMPVVNEPAAEPVAPIAQQQTHAQANPAPVTPIA